MPDTKITALTALTAADPANDVLPIVDVSDTTMAASGTTKKISINNVLGCSGTATLASATITGDLTVDTNTLKVDSANNRVGIGTASPIDVFQISSQNPNIYLTDSGIAGSDQVNLYFGPNTIPTYSGILVDISNDNFNIRHNSSTRLSIGATGIFTWQNVGGVAGTAMTLNSSGLGVGTSPSYNLDVRAATATANVQSSTGTNAVSIVARNTGGSFTLGKENSVGGGSGVFGQDAYASVLWSTGAYPLILGTNGAHRLQIDSVGNTIPIIQTTAPTLTLNGQMVFNLTSNTNLRISVRGTDGTTRTANITLA